MRYIILVIINLPIILLALLNIITKYKMGRVPKRRFINQMVLWVGILIVLVGSFPVYNLVMGRPILDSSELSVFDIVQTTLIVFLFYAVNDQIRKNELTDRRLRDLQQELSIRLSLNAKAKR